MNEQSPSKLIAVCINHADHYPTPLIWTFKFSGAEWWCPFCGHTCGAFGLSVDVPRTEELQNRHDLYKKAASHFLSTDSTDWKYNREIEKQEIDTR